VGVGGRRGERDGPGGRLTTVGTVWSDPWLIRGLPGCGVGVELAEESSTLLCVLGT
jgi:hypothetical protein